MGVAVRPLLFKPHRLNGVSDRLLVSHYENDYGADPPARLGLADALPRERAITVNRIHDFRVSGNAGAKLRRRGYDARSLKGDIAAWHAIGRRTVPLDRGGYDA